MVSGVLTSDIIEIIEPESKLFDVLSKRAIDIVKYECKLPLPHLLRLWTT